VDVSAVIPTKDRLVTLQRVLPSFLRQGEIKEIIVIVDGSTDGTVEYLEQLCRESEVVRYLDNGVNRGIPYSRNRGIDAATGDYIFMAEDDLELSDGFLSTLLDHMASMSADVICGRNIFRRDNETAAESIARTDKLTGSYVNMKTIEIQTGMNIGIDREEPILAGPMLARTAVFREVRYNDIYRVNFWREETDFQLSAREHGYRLASCPHAICFNFDMTDDRGGVHAAVGLRREQWVIINNWRFINQHEAFIKSNFPIANKWSYIFKFSVGRIVKYIILPPVVNVLSTIKRRVLRRSLSRSA
jgi:glycosyltransferase involved in cell wall biosynthesis